MNGELIQFAGGEEVYEGYLSVPSSGSGPGVIVIQEWWGLVPHILAVTDRFAAAGFTALAPDLYRGVRAEDPDEAASLMMALHIGDTSKLLASAIDALIEDPATTGERVGVVGFCMGGQLSLYAACDNWKIAACIDYYGIHPNVQPVLRELSGPLLGFFAEHDDYAGPDQVHALTEELTLLGKPHEFITYPGTHHAFFNDTRPAYNKEAADDSWKRAVAFFHESLSS